MGIAPCAHAESKPDSGSAAAVRSGKKFEKRILQLFQDFGVKTSKYRDWKKEEDPQSRILLQNVPHQMSLFGKRGITEFLFRWPARDVEVRIDAKYQRVRSTSRRRIVYAVLNALEHFPERHIIFVIDGPGWSEGAIRWAKSAGTRYHKFANHPDKKVEVMTYGEFQAWLATLFKTRSGMLK